MQVKHEFPDRPRLDRGVRWVMWIAVLILAVAAVLDRDPRQGAAVVGIASFVAAQTLVLSAQVERVLAVVSLVAVVAWLALLVS